MKVKSFTVTGNAQEFLEWLRRYQQKQVAQSAPAISGLQLGEQEYLFTYLVPLEAGAASGVIQFQVAEEPPTLRVTCQLDSNPNSAVHLRRLWQALRREQFRVALLESGARSAVA